MSDQNEIITRKTKKKGNTQSISSISFPMNRQLSYMTILERIFIEAAEKINKEYTHQAKARI